MTVLLFLSGCATTMQRPGSPSDGSCNAVKGAWEGTLSVHSETTNDSAVHDEVTLRLAFTGEQPKVYLVERGTWMESKPGSFRARCLGPSAVVHAIDSARDADGTWVETWVLAVTVRDPEELMARWIRMVNNVDLPLTNRSSKFGSEGVGILRRVPVSATDPGCREGNVDESTTIGDVFERQCNCGNADNCEVLAMMLEQQGDNASLARAKEARQKGCGLGHQESCAPAR